MSDLREDDVHELTIEGGSSELERIVGGLNRLRQQIIDAWQERSVILTRTEQEQLRHEIKDTCEVLSGLVSN